MTEEYIAYMVIIGIVGVFIYRLIIVPIIQAIKGDSAELDFMIGVFAPIILAVLIAFILGWAFNVIAK